MAFNFTYTTSKVSIVWKYFTKENPKIVKCKVCNKLLRYSGSTTTMRQHLDRLHPLVMAMAGDSLSSNSAIGGTEVVVNSQGVANVPGHASAQQLDVKARSPSSTNSQSSFSERENAITSAICSFMARDMVPVSVVDGVGFKKLIQMLEPGYRIPSLNYFEDQLRTGYMMGREKLKTLMQSTEAMALSFYTWAGMHLQMFFSVMVHFIGDKNEMQNFVLTTCAIPEKQSDRSAENMLQVLLDNLADYELDEGKITAVVHCNSPGLVECVDLFRQEMNCEAISCMGYRLNECIKMALSFPDIDETINAARKMASYFRPGTPAASEMQKQAVKPQSDVQPDLTKHWPDVFEMCRSLTDQRPIISTLLTVFNEDEEFEEYVCPDLTEQQWETLHAIVKVLMPLAGAVKVLSQEKFIAISSLRAVLHSMEKTLEVKDDDPPAVQKLKETIHTEMKQRFQLEQMHPSPLTNTIATALDPRHKMLKYHSAAQRQQMQDALTEIVETERQRLELQQTTEVQRENTPPKKRRKSQMTDLLGSDSEDSDDEPQQRNRVEAEIQAYTCDKVLSKESDPLEWWHLNETRYPTLAATARRYLCIPCTAALPQDAFTKSEIAMMPVAAAPTPDMVDCLMFLNYNEKL